VKARAIATVTVSAACALCTPVVAYYEGMVPQTYSDPVGIPTICYGHTGVDVVPGRIASEPECRELLSADLLRAVDGVNQCIRVPLSVPQAAALVSFTFNVGSKNLCSSTLAREANAGDPPERWCYQLDRWVYATKLGFKLRMPGLVKRRATERRICLGDLTAVPA
jgi:lysozyme